MFIIKQKIDENDRIKYYIYCIRIKTSTFDIFKTYFVLFIYLLK